jgi:replication factor C subunit 3/5
MPAAVRIKLVDAMADVEHRLAYGTSERLQLGSLVGAFTVARDGIVASAT